MATELMEKREAEIAKVVQVLKEKSGDWTDPRLVVIGGYALRAFVPFSRYSRDLDLVLKEGLDTVKGWKPRNVALETFERHGDHAFMRWSKGFRLGKRKLRLGVDFLEGKVTGREGEAFAIDDTFLEDSQRVELDISDRTFEVLVPAYRDFFTLKVISARRSDVRDVAALVWKNGVPERLRLSALDDPEVFHRKLEEEVIPEIEHEHFLDSWRGMFVTEEFGEEDRVEVLEALREL